ncbi:MAG: gliding motility-associated C-terminal domain-containing protein [Bacteroidales bacterium]|nr:gliding motility-associated C-terminal domain-containing protein [Bacteroidales bacterium]
MTLHYKYFLPGLFFTLSVLIGNIGCGWSQISSPWADYSDTVDYPEFSGTDLFYIFHSPVESPQQRYGRLVANPPAGSTPGWDFEWSKYDTVNKVFGTPFFTQPGDSSSEISNLESGGYQVRITGPDTDTTFRAWVYRNSPIVEVEKTDEGLIKRYKYTCDYLQLNGTAAAEEHIYYDLAAGKRLSVPNAMSFEWTSDNDDVKIQSPSFFLNPRLSSNLPSVDTWFILTAVDSFGLVQDDSAYYETIHTKAEFKIKIEDEENEGVWIEPSENKGEAPLIVRFINLSENGVKFQWSFVDSAKTGEGSTATTFILEDSVEFTYYIPNYYFPKLISISYENCKDSFPNTFQNETPIEIQVEPSKLDMMNVFTPNNDGINDIFLVDAKSLRDFKISIYNRWGKLVYEHIQTEDRWDWEGWDGTILGKGNRKAEPGVYFYVIEAIGWDAKKFRKGIYRGFVYLFMDKESL